MKKTSAHSFFNRLFCLLMALYVLNFSVDPPDGHVRITACGEAKEDLRVNEMESIGEWVLEHILGITNAIPEHDASDDYDGKVTKSFFYWVASEASMSFLLPPAADTIHPATYTFCPPIFFPYYMEVTSPPPWRS